MTMRHNPPPVHARPAASGFIGDITDTIVILVIVMLNAVIGFIQEYRAEKAIAALRQMAAPVARVLRDGRSHSIATQELVPGDIVLLDTGADECRSMQMNRAMEAARPFTLLLNWRIRAAH